MHGETRSAEQGPRGAGVRRDPRTVRAAYERFLGTGELPGDIDPVVAESWRRSLRSGVDPDTPHLQVALGDAELAAYRASHPLAAVMPVVRELVVDGAADDGLVVAVSDEIGRLLWVEGNHRLRGTVDRVGFVEGAVWREESVGTNAPGTALATRRAVQVIGAEHYSRPVQELSCAAAPIRDPATGRVLGVLDVTGRRAAASHVVLSLVRATVATVERELAHRAAASAGTGGLAARPAVDLRVLGRPVLRTPGGEHRLSLRHAEILLLLAEHPRGLGADELAVLLHPGELSDVTVRAEVSRLRHVVGALLAGSRPYRLARPLRTDADAVRDGLAAGDVRGAVAAYAPLLPRSVAPGVERLRAELTAEVRAAVLASGDLDALDAWVRGGDGADEHAAWARLLALAPAGSPQAVRARARVTLLDTELS
ncbi:GAF domain-containing protein [Krasilnikoviella flava]|uniref:GAF domain-containing protein n=1 Tax=Krasilnikoviella flava TaxID=526729 RepID=A0A1T5JJU1_9MICO|nr:GAF domain-containing protein [Krasilnikoviella flava]SKC51626.1 GAF domain-containing protein [Krasilnikoviella flava]